MKRWHDGQLAIRSCTAGMVEAGKQFRRVNGHLHVAALRTSLEADVSESVAPTRDDEEVNAD